ncbi:MAG: hypothetical protein R3A80_09075 [Bdellovibrionota bacterium]
MYAFVILFLVLSACSAEIKTSKKPSLAPEAQALTPNPAEVAQEEEALLNIIQED